MFLLQTALHFLGDLGHGILGAAAGGAADDLGSCHGIAHSPQNIKACAHFCLRLVGQGNAQRVTDALHQQAADAHAGLDQAHAGGTCLGDAHMQRVVALLAEQTVGSHHAGHVGRFDGNHNVGEIVFFQQADVVKRTFHHGLRHRGAVFGQDMLFQAAAVDTDADGHIFGVAGIRHRLDIFIGADVAGIDTDFVSTRIQCR